MVANQFKPHLIATGGEENDLKIWDLQNPKIPVFTAKNVSTLINLYIYIKFY